jgi:hypothetical protein
MVKMLRIPETVCIVLRMGQIDPLAVAIGTAVRGAVVEADLSLTQFAEEAGFSWQTLSRRVNGHTPFTYSELVRVAEITGTTVSDLVQRADRIHKRQAA